MWVALDDDLFFFGHQHTNEKIRFGTEAKTDKEILQNVNARNHTHRFSIFQSAKMMHIFS